jgi:hypothetical protein
MSRALALSQRQARTLLRAAEAERGIVEVKIGDTVIRLIPECLAQAPRLIDDEVSPEAFDTLDQYLAWRDRSGAGGA